MHIEINRERNHSNTQKCQQSSRPRYAQSFIHIRSEQRKTSSHKRTRASRSGQCTVCIQQVYVDDIDLTWQKHQENPTTDEDSRQDLWHPDDVWIAGPRKPKKPSWKDERPDDHRRQSGLGKDKLSRSDQLGVEAALGIQGDVASTDQDSAEECEERKCGNAFLPAADDLEGVWIGEEDEVENAVHQTGV